MRTLTAPPSAVVDPVTHALAVGSFRGGVPRVDTSLGGKGPLFRVAHEKRWIYAAIASGDLFVAAAVVRLGYVANAFAFAFDRNVGRIVARTSIVAPPFAAQVGDTGGEGARAVIRWPGANIGIVRRAGERDYKLEIDAPDLTVSARLSSASMPPRIGAIAEIPGPSGLFNATEKGALLPVTGEAIARGRRYDLDGALGGYDFTCGLLARRTAWRWAFALGHAKSGERVALNLVQGFVGEPECAVWIDGDLLPVSEGRIDLDTSDPRAPWRVSTVDREIDLRFEPGDVHAEHRDYGVVSSKFIQPIGAYSGSIRVPDRAPIELDRVLGVAEDQDILW